MNVGPAQVAAVDEAGRVGGSGIYSHELWECMCELDPLLVLSSFTGPGDRKCLGAQHPWQIVVDKGLERVVGVPAGSCCVGCAQAPV